MATNRVVVIRVISDGHKDELAFITLAPATLHEENSFFTTWHTRDKSFRRDILEKDLQTIYPLLNNNLWFAFDYESVAKTLQRLYASVNQSPPQSAGYLEASQLFGSTFSQSNNSLAFAAQFLHILPWNNQNTNAKTECDITWEVLNRIALNLVVGRWAIPNQSSPSDDQINANHEITANRDETTINQSPQMTHTTNVSGHSHHHTHTHAHPHSSEQASYEADVNDPNNNEMARRHEFTHTGTDVDVQHPITDERNTMEMNYEELGGHHHHHQQQQHDNTLNDTNVKSEEETNLNFSKDTDFDNKTSEEFANTNTETQSFPEHLSHSKDVSYQGYDTTQTGDVHTHYSHLTGDTRKDANEESHETGQNDEFLGENVDSNQPETRGATAEDEQTTKHAGLSSQRVRSSWKDLAKGGQATTAAPSRTSQLHIVQGVVNKKAGGAQGRFKPFPPTRDPKTIKQYISNAMSTNRVLWVSYDGGNQPLVPRGVKPTKWDDHPGTELAFLGVPFHSKTGKESKFFLRDVKEVRDKYWVRPEDMKSNPNKNKTTQGQRGERNGQGQGQGQGGSRNDKKSPSNGISNTNDNSNVEESNTNTDQTRSSKRKQQQQQPRENKKPSTVGNTSESNPSTQE